MKHAARAAALGLLVAAFGGCTRFRPASAMGSVQKTPPESVRGGVRDIVRAACEREERCGELGIARPDVDLDACTTRVGARMRAAINPDDCDAVDRERLRVCLRRITTRVCMDATDGLDGMDDCGPLYLCTTG